MLRRLTEVETDRLSAFVISEYDLVHLAVCTLSAYKTVPGSDMPVAVIETLRKVCGLADIDDPTVRHPQIDPRHVIRRYAESAEGRPTDFSTFESVYKALGDKLRPKVYAYGFLRQ